MHATDSCDLDVPPEQRRSSPTQAHHTSTPVFELIPGRLSFAAHSSLAVTLCDIDAHPKRFYFSTNYQERYVPFTLDFGPVNLAVVHKFCVFLRKFWNHRPASRDDTLEDRTNTAFLLAAFMVVDLGYTPEDAWAPFARMPEGTFATFRDATFCEQTYGLTVLACLRGLSKALLLGWYSPSTFSANEYHLLESSEAGDMHLVSPKFLAFKGPLDPSAKPVDELIDKYALPPEHYARAFTFMGVSGVVRLNEASTYDRRAFTDEGFAHHDIYFDDCTIPGSETVQAFLEAVEKEEGVVAVHCRAGLGRTGTLIAVYFMEHHGFTAAEAIGWLRIVRPGSVIGDQQHFLHWYEGTQGGRVASSLPADKLFNIRRTPSGRTVCGDPEQAPEELGRMVKRAQIDKVRRLQAAPHLPHLQHLPHLPASPPDSLPGTPPPQGARAHPALPPPTAQTFPRGDALRKAIRPQAQGSLAVVSRLIRNAAPRLPRRSRSSVQPEQPPGGD